MRTLKARERCGPDGQGIGIWDFVETIDDTGDGRFGTAVGLCCVDGGHPSGHEAEGCYWRHVVATHPITRHAESGSDGPCARCGLVTERQVWIGYLGGFTLEAPVCVRCDDGSDDDATRSLMAELRPQPASIALYGS